MSIDQQTRRRMSRTGLTGLDRDKACPGYVLYSPMGVSGDAYLINLDGEEVHHWSLPHPPGLYGYILPNGNLFYGGKIHDETWERFASWKRFKGGVMLEATPGGEIVWEHHDIDHHHDARRTESGGATYLTVEEMPQQLAAQVKGGIAGSGGGTMWADVIVEVDAAGNRVWEWHAAEHLNTETDVISFNDLRLTLARPTDPPTHWRVLRWYSAVDWWYPPRRGFFVTFVSFCSRSVFLLWFESVRTRN